MFERLTGLGTCTSFSVDERHFVFAAMRGLIDFHDYGGMQLYWARGLDGGPVQALYRWQDPEIIYVRPFERLAVNVREEQVLEYKSSAIRLMMPSIVHELVHRRQLKRMGKLAYWLCSIPGLYYTCLDKEAFDAERAAALKLGLAQGDYEGFGDGSRG